MAVVNAAQTLVFCKFSWLFNLGKMATNFCLDKTTGYRSDPNECHFFIQIDFCSS